MKSLILIFDQDICKKKGLAIYPRDDLGKAHFIMISANHQFEHIAKSKSETMTEFLHKRPKRSIPLFESMTPSRLSSRMQPSFPLPARTHHANATVFLYVVFQRSYPFFIAPDHNLELSLRQSLQLMPVVVLTFNSPLS